MKKLIPMLFVVVIIATGCPQPEPEVHQVEIGLFTPYSFFPETLNGNVKQVVETNYLGTMEEGEIVKGDRLTVSARDSISWTIDFKVVYDEAGNVMETVVMDENDKYIAKIKTTIEEGKVVRTEEIRNDTLRKYNLVTYNEAGQVNKIDRFRLPADTLIWSARLLSDDQGNFLEWNWTDWKGDDLEKFLFTVNQEGRRTGYKYYNKEGEVVQEQKFTYNELGFIVKQVDISDGGESVYEYAYEYDEMNNWIKAIASNDGHSIVTERTYTYFE